jgi:hypothetical protein
MTAYGAKNGVRVESSIRVFREGARRPPKFDSDPVFLVGECDR